MEEALKDSVEYRMKLKDLSYSLTLILNQLFSLQEEE